MQNEILGILRENEEQYVSGEHISRMLGISRATVWKHVQKLQREGFVIDAVTRKGYRLMSAGDVLHPALIEPMLTTRTLGRNLVCLARTSSTNSAAKELAIQGCRHGTVVLTDDQTEGRGRRGRSWTSAPGKDIAMSIVLRPALEAAFASRYTFATALGVYRLAEGLGLEPAIKWPNDVLLGGRKFCGMLFEMTGDMDALHTVIVGIGININTEEFPEELRQTATSLRLSLHRTLARCDVAATLLNLLEPFYGACSEDAGYQALHQEYITRCGTIGQRISVTGIRETLEGTAQGVDEMGRLLLRTDDGTLHALLTGDVTLRKDPLK